MDTRKKACPNSKCDTYKKKKYDNKINFCPTCGNELIYVCKSVKCYKPIQNIGPKHSYCQECLDNRADRKDKVISQGKKVAGSVGAIAVAAFTKEGRKVVKNVAEKAAKQVFKI